MTIFNINKNNSLEALQQLVEQNLSKKLSYMPESFNAQQQQALELFKQRLFLEKIIDEAISFNKNLNFPNENKNLHLTTTAEDLIDVFKLRSDVYTSINYQNEFPDVIGGLNFDKYDSNSAILFYKNGTKITGTIRVITDSFYGLPSEDKFSFMDMRNKYTNIVEISRIIVENEKSGMNLEFKYLMYGLYNILIYNNINLALFGIKEEHYKLYSKFGGMVIVKKLKSYGTFNMPCLIVSWDLSQVSPFFKKAFLDQK